MPYFEDWREYVKCMVLITVLFTDGLKVLIAKQKFLNFFIKFYTRRSQFMVQFNQTSKNLVLDV
jgi:hypothetical protein